MLVQRAIIGTPFLEVLVKVAGSVCSFPNDQSILVEAYRPELAAEMIAIKTTKFIRSEIKGRCSCFKT